SVVRFFGNIVEKYKRNMEAIEVALRTSGGTDPKVEQLFRFLCERAGQYHDRGGTVTDFIIYRVRCFDNDFGCGVLDIDLAQKRGSVLSHCNLAHNVDKHFFQAARPK